MAYEQFSYYGSLMQTTNSTEHEFHMATLLIHPAPCTFTVSITIITSSDIKKNSAPLKFSKPAAFLWNLVKQ
jgi:hypothetical protein